MVWYGMVSLARNFYAVRWGGARSGKVWQGGVGLGVAWHGPVWFGLVSLARNFYKVGLGEVRLGWAGRGLAWQGRVGFGLVRFLEVASDPLAVGFL